MKNNREYYFKQTPIKCKTFNCTALNFMYKNSLNKWHHYDFCEMCFSNWKNNGKKPSVKNQNENDTCDFID